jgi:hypothetical protein
MQLLKNFPTFYGTRRLSTVFTSARLSVRIPSHPISLRFILIMSPIYVFGLPSALFTSGFPTNILYALLLSPIRSTCPAHRILFDFIIHHSNYTWPRVQVMKILIRQFSPIFCAFILFRSNYTSQYPVFTMSYFPPDFKLSQSE